MSRDRSDTGEYVETVSTDHVLAVFDSVDGPVVTSADVADALDCTTETARRKLKQLYQEGRVNRRKTAGRVVWWLTESEQATAEIDPDGPLFTGGAIFATDEPTDASKVDEYLYGEIENADG